MAESAQEKLDILVGRVRKVRRWLVALAILKVAALCLIFVSVYVGIYAWLDHQLHFGQASRIVALILLLAGIGLLLHRLTKLLLGHISCSAAANYIENKQSFDQQLVTAIEYYESKQDYPYSNALAEQLVLQVERDSEEYRFDAVVQKWQGYVLGAVVLFGLVVTWFYVKDNYIYFASYFARLIRPTASIEALSPTHLESITKDMVVEPDSEVTFTAEIEGRVPEFGEFVIMDSNSKSAEGTERQKGGSLKAEDFGDGSIEAIPKLRLRLPPIDDGQMTRLEASRSFSETGRFKYRFEAGSASTSWHTLNVSPSPDIKGMTAQVTLPRQPLKRKWIKPYTEQIENNKLEVLPGSNITLDVQTTGKLKEIVATGLDGKPITKSLDGAKQFTFHFTADKSGSVRFDLVNELGLTNDDLPGLDVIVKTDEPPAFELICPDGDYLATDVASVPVTFEVTDDFGLESVEMCLEIPGHKPMKLPVSVEEGVRSKTFTHMIELEEYNLNISDSILFYARATDIDTGSTVANRSSSSEVYFIEIRPYKQNWRPKSGGPSQSGMPAPVELLNILEYTRAIVKKTWAIAEKSPALTDEDRSTLKSIDNDVQYCAEQLTLIRDDSDYGFTEAHKSVLNAVLMYYEQASRHLAKNDAASALMPEKNAYRVLRKFILESDLELSPPQSGQSPPDEKPDSVKMQEKPPEYAEMEAERVEGELEQMQQKLDKLTKEQEILKRTFKNFLEQKDRNQQSSQKAVSQESSEETGEQGQDKKAENQQSQSSPSQQGKQSSSDQKSEKKQNATGGQSGSQGQESSESESTSGSPSSDNKQSNAADQSQSGYPDANDQQNTTEKQNNLGEQGSEKDNSATESPGSDDNRSNAGIQSNSDRSNDNSQPSRAEGQSGSKEQGAEKSESASKGSDAGDKQTTTESQSGSKGQDSGGNQGPTGSPGSDEKRSESQGQGNSDGQKQGEDKNASSQSGTGEGQDNSGRQADMANNDLRLRMLQAKQKDLQERVSQLKRDLQQLPRTSQSNSNEGRAQAQKHLDEALERMNDFQDKLTESRYQAEMSAKQSSEALETVEAAQREMDLAQKAIENELTWNDDQRMANEAQEMAEQLAADADSFDESVTDAEREDMLARLEAAKRLLETMPEPKWAQVGRGRRSLSPHSPVLTKNPNIAPAEAARQMARQFWSIALDAKKRRQHVVEDKSSDVKFIEQENKFFENAAKFELEPGQK